MSSSTLQESGVTYEFPEDFRKKLSSARTFSYLAISHLLDEFYSEGSTPLACVEAVPGLGLAGIQWKKLFKEKVKVTINTSDGESLKIVKENAERNIGTAKDIDVTHQDTNALLHSRKKFNFIYLEAYGTCVKYLESAFHVICHRGIICVVSTDLSTLYNKSPSRIQRIYHGNTMKNEYVRELGARLILANIVRAASRWDRGVSVLLSYMDDNCIIILVRALKGATHADKSIDLIQKVAHCRVCHYRYMVNEKLHYTPQPDICNCMCVDSGVVNGEILPPIVMLGPAYAGPIFATQFLWQIRKSLLKLDKESKLCVAIKNMVLESLCLKSEDAENEFLELIDKEFLDGKVEEQEPAPKKSRIETDSAIEKFLEERSDRICPIFFYIPQTYTKGGFNPPKISVVIKKLRSEGYQACKTLFDPRGVRTSATSKQFYNLINSIATETSHQ